MSEHALLPGHNESLVEYIRFLRRKRDTCVAEVAAEFKELKESRLFEDDYTKEDVEALIDGLLAVVRNTMKRDIQTSMHSSVLLLKQALEQAEKAGITIDTDFALTEDRYRCPAQSSPKSAPPSPACASPPSPERIFRCMSASNLLEAVAVGEGGISAGTVAPQLRARAALSTARPAPSLAQIGQAQVRIEAHPLRWCTASREGVFIRSFHIREWAVAILRLLAFG